MPPKKGDKKEKKAAAADVTVGPEEQAKQYKLQSEALQRQLAERTDKCLSAEREAEELRLKLRRMVEDQGATGDGVRDVTAEMARQYRGMQENLQGRVAGLEAEQRGLREQLAEARRQIEEAQREQGALGSRKDAEIASLREQIEAMASEFGDSKCPWLRIAG